MSKFDPPKPQALTPGELVQAIARFGADSAGVAKAVELIQIQDQLKAQDEFDAAAWVSQMLEDRSDKALAALRKAGYDEQGVFLGADLAPDDISDPLPETETRVENKRIVLETGLEGQFSGSASSQENLTRHGKLLTSPAAALETATADIVTYFQPKSSFIDEIPILASGVGIAATFGYALSGNAESFGLILGFLLGAVLSFVLSRVGKGFPGIFALTSFGVVGARFLRGVLSGASVVALVSFLPAALSPAQLMQLEAGFTPLLWGGIVLVGTAIGLMASGKRLAAVRTSLSVLLVAGVAVLSFLAASSLYLEGFALSFISVAAGAIIGLLLNSILAFSTTVGRMRFHLSLTSLSSVAFTVSLLLVVQDSFSFATLLICVIVGLSLAASFAAASSSRGRFWSGLAGSTVGIGLVLAMLFLLPESEPALAFVVALAGAWLAIISFDSLSRNGRLHLASLNRSYGFYGPFSWLAILVLLLSGLMGASLALFSPLSEILPPVLGAPVVSMVLALVFSLIRLPEIRAQEEEILLAVSRVSAGNQVGIQ